LDSISIPISFERPNHHVVFSQPRTRSENPIHYEDIKKPLFIERSRQPYANSKTQSFYNNNIVEEPQFKRPISNTTQNIHIETEPKNLDQPRRSTSSEVQKSDPYKKERLESKSELENYPDPKALLERLKVYGMKEKTSIRGNGNCQFAAFSDQYFNDIKYAAEIRNECVKWLMKNKYFVLTNGAKMENFLQTDFFPTWQDYCEYMSVDGTWGDNLTLVALSELFRTKIVIISSIKLSKNQNPCTVIVPSKWENNKVVYLSHLHELHYSSICPDDDFTTM